MAVYDPRGTTPVHTDKVLTNVSMGFPQGDFLGSAFFPAVNVVKQSDKYFVFGRESWGVPVGNDLRAPGTEAMEVPGLNVSTDSYFAQEHALAIPVTDEEIENVDSPLSPLVDGTELITMQLFLIRELAIKTLLLTAANYPAAHTVTLAGATQWSAGTSFPITDVRTARTQLHSAIKLEPTIMAIPYEVMAQLENHTTILARIQYSERGVITPELISQLFGGVTIKVPGAGYNSANPGQAAAIGYIWGKDVVLAFVPSRPGLKIPALGYEFVWGRGGAGMNVERWREEKRKSDLVRVSRRYDLKFVAKDGSGKALAGYLIKAAVA